MPYPYSSTLFYMGVAPQTAIGSPAGAPTIILPIMRQQTRHMEWMTGRRAEQYATGDFYTTQDAPINQPHSQGTIVVPARPTQLAAFFALCGFAGGAAPGQPLLPPTPMTVFQGLGAEEEQFSDVFCAGASFNCPENGNATWSIPLMGMTQQTSAAFRQVTIPPFETAYKMHHLMPVTLLGTTGAVRFNSLRVDLTIDSVPQYYSRGDGLPEASDILLQELGGSGSFRRAYKDGAERSAFLQTCGQEGIITFPFKQVCGGTTHDLAFTFQNGIYSVRTSDSPDRAPIGETLNIIGLRGPAGAPSPILVAYD